MQLLAFLSILSGGGSSGPSSVNSSVAASAVPSTPKRLLGSLLSTDSAKAAAEAESARLEEELMTLRIAEVESQAELKDQRLKVMELETQVSVILATKTDFGLNHNMGIRPCHSHQILWFFQNQVIANQLKRQNEAVTKLSDALEAKNMSEYKLQSQLREAQRKHAGMLPDTFFSAPLFTFTCAS